MARLSKNKLSLDEILTTGQVAKYCQVDARTVNRWIQEGILKSYALPITGFKRIKVRDFLDFLKEQKFPVSEDFLQVSKTKILIVDDDAAMAHSIHRMLNYGNNDSFACEIASNGFEAGRMLQKVKPDLIILDIRMPLMDGFQVCKLIRSDSEMKFVKVLAISGFMSEEDRRNILTAGANEFLEKPFTDETLKASVSRLLGKVWIHENTKSNQS